MSIEQCLNYLFLLTWGQRQVYQEKTSLSNLISPVYRTVPMYPSSSSMTPPAQWLASNIVTVIYSQDDKAIVQGFSNYSYFKHFSLGYFSNIKDLVIELQYIGPQSHELLNPFRWSIHIIREIPAWMWVRKWMYLLKGLLRAVENQSTITLVWLILTIVYLRRTEYQSLYLLYLILLKCSLYYKQRQMIEVAVNCGI